MSGARWNLGTAQSLFYPQAHISKTVEYEKLPESRRSRQARKHSATKKIKGLVIRQQDVEYISFIRIEKSPFSR